MKPPNIPCMKCGEVHWSREPCVTKASSKSGKPRELPLGTQTLKAVKDPRARAALAKMPRPKVIVRRSPRGR